MRIGKDHGGYTWMEQCLYCSHIISNRSFALGTGLCPMCGSQEVNKIVARWEWEVVSSWPYLITKRQNKHVRAL